MLSLVNSDTVSSKESEKQALVNRIITAGLNSLAVYTQNNYSNSDERKLLDAFVSQSFDKIMPCWSGLDEKIKFYIFKTYMSDFESFMMQKSVQGVATNV